MSLRTLVADNPRARIAGVIGLVCLLAAGVLVVVSDGRDPSGSYRTATATQGSVDQVLQTVASIEPVTQATVAFPIAGTVDTVEVSAGDRVDVGAELASLDTASLERSLREKQAGLDQAELSLERALNGEAVTGAGGPTGGATPTALDTSSGGDGQADLGEVQLIAAPQTGGPSDADIAAAQQALLAAQQQADAALAAVQPAIDNANSVCASVGTVDQASYPAALAACTNAIAAVTTAQQAAQSSQAAVSSAAATYDDLLAQRAAALAAQPTTTTTTPPQTTPAEPSQPSGSAEGAVPSGGGSFPSSGEATGATGSSVSSERLIALQKEVDVAVLEVLVAQQAVAQAAVVSPLAGTVVSVNMAPGDEVDAASSTANIVVAGRGGYEATVSVSVDDLADLEVGQKATVIRDASGEDLDGEVVAIGVAANAGSFPVTIGLDGNTRDLGNGSTASVGITTKAADDVLAVPTSAVTVNGDQATVEVRDGDDTKTVTVEIGAIGATWTEIVSGLDEGQEVVVADLDEPLPGSATDTSGSTATVGGPSGFNGGPFAPPGR